MAIETIPPNGVKPDKISPPTRGQVFTLGEVADIPLPKESTIDLAPSFSAAKKMRTRTKVLLGSAVIVAALGGTGLYAERHPDQASAFLRSTIGRENKAKLEDLRSAVKDRVDRLQDQVLGKERNPFGEYTPEVKLTHASAQPPFFEDYIEPDIILPPEPPKPIVLPETTILLSKAEPGEGVWVTKDLPYSSREDILMAKTFIRPDAVRPYASVAVLLIDKRRIRLNMVAGTAEPGGSLGNRGPGRIPDEDKNKLLVAFNGGFLAVDGHFGMYANGKTYRPLLDGVASVAVLKDGTIKMGTWGENLSWDDDMVAVRQNTAMLIEDGQVTRLANEHESNNWIWGFIDTNSAAFITRRSAIGLDKNGNLMIASGNHLSAKTLAQALQAAGAYQAFHLDMNTPWVLTSLFEKQDDGLLKAKRFVPDMSFDPAGRFLADRQERDFFYVTRDETNFQPTPGQVIKGRVGMIEP